MEAKHEQTPPGDQAGAPYRAWRQMLAAGLGFVLFITIMTLAINAIGVEEMQTFVEQAGPLAPLAYILIKALTYIVAPLTSGPIQVFAGTLFGSVWLGVLYTLIGEVIGGSISFWIARRFGRPVVARLVGQEGMRQVDEFYQSRMGGWQSLAVARIVLFSVWDFLSYAAGLAPVRFVSYVWVSILVGFFPTFFFVVLGNTLVEDTSSLVLVYGLVGVLIIVPLLMRKPLERWLARSSKPVLVEEEAA